MNKVDPSCHRNLLLFHPPCNLPQRTSGPCVPLSNVLISLHHLPIEVIRNTRPILILLLPHCTYDASESTKLHSHSEVENLILHVRRSAVLFRSLFRRVACIEECKLCVWQVRLDDVVQRKFLAVEDQRGIGWITRIGQVAVAYKMKSIVRRLAFKDRCSCCPCIILVRHK